MKLNQKDLQKFFHPKSIAIVGASTGEFKLGGTSFMLKLQEGGYAGKLYPINPKADEIAGETSGGRICGEAVSHQPQGR
jgi:acyl-CoA synthetase (NDP forming)